MMSDQQVANRQTTNWQWFLFSLKGRVSRRQYWLNFLLPVLVVSLLLGVLSGVLYGWDENGPSGPIDWLATLWGIAILWPGIATQVKRWHDRNKSGWWYLINLVPLIGGIWAFVETGCLAGTEGENRYGTDPKQQVVQITDSKLS